MGDSGFHLPRLWGRIRRDLPLRRQTKWNDAYHHRVSKTVGIRLQAWFLSQQYHTSHPNCTCLKLAQRKQLLRNLLINPLCWRVIVGKDSPLLVLARPCPFLTTAPAWRWLAVSEWGSTQRGRHTRSVAWDSPGWNSGSVAHWLWDPGHWQTVASSYGEKCSMSPIMQIKEHANQNHNDTISHSLEWLSPKIQR